MRIILDEATLDDTRDTLAEAINLGAERAAARGRVVVDIYADGQPISAAELDDALVMAHDCAELRLTTAEPRSFVRVTLLDAAEALGQARGEQQRAAQLIEAGSVVEAYQILDGALHLWQAARQALDQGAQLVGLDLTELPLNDPEDLSSAIARLSAALEEVRRCVSVQDWAGLSDVLLYDLEDLVGTWQMLLTRAAAHLAG